MVEINTSTTEQAVAEGGAYEVIHKRLMQQGAQLQTKVDILNQARAEEFGQTELKIIGRVRVRTENNCVPRDIVRVGHKQMLFGYNVYIGLKKETAVEDVFALYDLIETESGFEVEAHQQDGHFLQDAKFVEDFKELYQYYKNTRLLYLQTSHDKLFAVFQIGRTLDDIRVFRWHMNEHAVNYIDNRGERDIPEQASHDFEWTVVKREDHVEGIHPHINILDEVFVDTVAGDLTIKVENNTGSGLGIFREPVQEPNQSLADADWYYAQVGSLILIKVRPYREETYRYLVFNTRSQQVNRIDAIGLSCVQLPDDHGLIFPGGYYLQNGETKVFENAPEGLNFSRALRSPNGEDAFYVFFEPEAGISALFSYNLIDKSLQNPIYAHGSCLFRDGKMLAFRAENEEPGRIHPMQVWETPYFHEEFQLHQPSGQNFFGKIGNSELVRGISDSYSLVRAIREQQVSVEHYEDLIAAGTRMFDAYHWLDATEVQVIEADIREICQTAELVLDEFEKVQSIRQQADRALAKAKTRQQEIINTLFVDSWKTAQEFVAALSALRQQQGHLTTLQEQRYIDTGALNALQEQTKAELEQLGQATVTFLNSPSALQSYQEALEQARKTLDGCTATVEIEPILEQLENISTGLDLLNETLAGLEVHDPKVRTSILEAISEIYSSLNQIKAQARLKRKSFRSDEAVAEFAAQFKLFGQSINSALETVDTPEQCDDQLSRLLSQLEELESRFADFDEFLADIIQQREQLFEVFQTRKQALLDERQRRIGNIGAALDRILNSIQRRCQSFTDPDSLNTFLAADAMVMKFHQLIEQLQDLKASVQADDGQSRLKAIQEQAIRSLRDQQDIFEDGGKLIKLGRHRFSVNTQTLDLTLMNRNQNMSWHLIGTDFYELLDNPELTALQAYWQQTLISETEVVYRAEYLAAELIDFAEQGGTELKLEDLYQAVYAEGELLKLVRQFAAQRYQEGYEKGVHDQDAVLILKQLLPLRRSAGLLVYTPLQRALAIAFWCFSGLSDDDKTILHHRALSAMLLQTNLDHNRAVDELSASLQRQLLDFGAALSIDSVTAAQATTYLIREAAQPTPEFSTSQQAQQLSDGLQSYLREKGLSQDFTKALQDQSGQFPVKWQLVSAWLEGYCESQSLNSLIRYIPEAVMLLLDNGLVQRQIKQDSTEVLVEGLLGEHPLIEKQSLTLAVDVFDQRLNHHRQTVIPAFQQFIKLKQSLIDTQRERLRLHEFQAKPLSSFVRNRLINEVYLPIIGDNLAKQMGSAGSNKRTDLMGLLLLISPPGYGKTTLMEYIANRLGLIFMKINCPSLGHDVHSLDPKQAPNATAAQELEKLNLALEMGNNVMLYLDDIQHTHAEFLQKFISLCDGSRRIEGVWKGKTRTYDMRGKKFCVIMAGNPYTESGEVFKIPDMLANRADIYNLGDVLSGNEQSFASSYIENSLTSNPVLQPLALRGMEDVYRFIKKAQGENVSDNAFEHPYSGAEMNEIVNVLKKMFQVRDVVLAVNRQYIESAAQDDRYRTEPPFKLQGSYRNMNKMAEKITAVLNDQELQDLITDHYRGEAQTLTRGAEENLLKLKALRGVLTEAEQQRWDDITGEYARLNRLGDDDDPAQQIVNQLSQVTAELLAIRGQLQDQSALGSLTEHIDSLREQIATANMHVEVVNQPVEGLDQALFKMAELFEGSFLPVYSAMEHKIKMEHDTWERVKTLTEEMQHIQASYKNKK